MYIYYKYVFIHILFDISIYIRIIYIYILVISQKFKRGVQPVKAAGRRSRGSLPV